MKDLKSVAEILGEMGFRSDSPVSSQEAFFRHLERAAKHESEIQARQRSKNQDSKASSSSSHLPPKAPEQLSFNFDPDLHPKKVS